MAYTRNRPLASDFLSSSQPILLQNINGSDDSFGVDHYQFSDTTANNGRHKIVQQTTLNAAGLNRTRSGAGATTANFPSNTPSINQTFAANYTPDFTGATADTQLFALTANGGLSQLTGNSSSTDGWQWIGGVLIQWGVVTSSSLSINTVTFKDRGPVTQGIPFPNNIFSITATPFSTAPTNPLSTPGSMGVTIVRDSGTPEPTTTSFRWRYSSTGGSYVPSGFYWIAIGN